MTESQTDPGQMWDKAAKMYNQMAAMEKEFTLNQINAIPILKSDTVLDCGCGPGRITVPVAARAKSVTAMDCAPKMLDYCKENVAKSGFNNVQFELLDFNKVTAGKEVAKHDIVICSRSAGLSDLERLTSFANKIVAIICWANAPSIPPILNDIFKGCSKDSEEIKTEAPDRRRGYNLMFNEVYDMGYEPNVSIVDDGFTRTFTGYDEAYENIMQLGKVDTDKKDVFKNNLNKWLIQNPDGSVTFLRETRSMVIWWEVSPKQF